MSFLKKVGKALGGSVGSIIGAGAGLLGGAMSASGQREANRQNYRIARENREWQQQMSNTAVRRRMEDMRRGGINPLLAAKYDASTPAGNIATMGNVGAAAATGFAQASQAGVNIEKAAHEIDQIEQQIQTMSAQEGLSEAQTDNVRELTLKVKEEVEFIKQETRKSRETTSKIIKEQQAIDYQLIIDSILTEFKQENPGLTIAQAFGLDAKTLMTFITGAVGAAGAGAFLKKVPKKGAAK